MRGKTFVLFRSSSGLWAIRYKLKFHLWKDWGKITLKDLDALYEIEPYYFQEKDALGLPEFKPVFRAWKNLQRAELWNESTVADFLTVLIGTSGYFEPADPAPPILKIFDPHPITKRTAAHPRGASRQKKKQPTLLLNLQPYLCDGKNIRAILGAWKPLWPRAMELLERRWKKIPGFAGGPPQQFNALGLHLKAHFQDAPWLCRIAFPEDFLKYWLPVCRFLTWKEVLACLRLFYDLRVDRDRSLLISISRMFFLSEEKKSLAWGQCMAGLKPSHRKSFSVLVNHSQIWKQGFDAAHLRQITELYNEVADEKLKSEGTTVVWGMRDGLSPAYLDEGLNLACRFDFELDSYPRKDCPDYPGRLISGLIDYVKSINEFNGYTFYLLWRACGEAPGLVKQLKQTEWTGYPPRTTYALLEFILQNRPPYPANRKELDKWNYLLSQIGALSDPLMKIPGEYHAEYFSNLFDVVIALETRSELKRILPLATRFLKRVCRPPFGRGNAAIRAVFYLLLFVPNNRVEELLEGPDSSFSRLEKACRSNNQSRLLRYGMEALCRNDIGMSLDGFLKFPSAFCRVAKKLGALPRYVRYQVVREMGRHPLRKIDVEKISPKRLYLLVENKCPDSLLNPVPKKLRQHFEEALPLTAARISGYTEKFKDKIPLMSLETLDHLIWKRLQKPFGQAPKNEDWEHALQVMCWIDDNRRSLRECIRSYLNGNWDYVERHPATLSWLKKNSKLNFEAWKEGLTLWRELGKPGCVTIEIEQNPLEILKMGTYVGSCLGLGGNYTFNAATVLLDINKQVLYARDSQGKVLGRQLIAISKKQELVCFDVYPDRVSSAIRNLFLEFDRMFAQKLSLPIFRARNDDDDYEIEKILSQDWYDDYCWEKPGMK